MHFHIDQKSGVPFYRQIIEQVKSGIAQGALTPGKQLPTVRQLSVDLSVNPNTVIRAYRQLEIEGVLETHQGSGTFVGPKAPELDAKERARALDQIVTELLARAMDHGLNIDDVSRALRERKEASR